MSSIGEVDTLEITFGGVGDCVKLWHARGV